MLKRILLSGVVALLCQVSLAADEPAWGLIVKLKTDAAASGTPTGKAFSQSLTTPASARARIATVMQHAGLPSAAQRALAGTGLYHVGTDRIVTHAQALALARQLMASGAVEWVVPNEREHLQAVVTTNDGYFPRSSSLDDQNAWWLAEATGTDSDPAYLRRRGNPNLDLAWGTSTGSSATIVAVLDTGLISHEDLDTARLLPGRNFHHGIDASGQISTTLDPNDPNDYTDPGDGLTQAEKDANPTAYANCEVQPSSWHGTAVTGVIAAKANNFVGVAGGDWATHILPVRIAGKCGAWESDIIDAMNWVAGDSSNGNTKRADVLNLSFSGSGSCDPAYQGIINTLSSRGVVVVVAAGNEHGSVTRPANCAGVVSVAALNRDGFKANYSNFGSAVTIATVGGDPGYVDAAHTQPAGVWGPYLGDSGILTLGNSGTTTVDTSPSASHYYFYAGTSMAAPIVSATVSLMLSVNPALQVADVIQGLQASARPHVTSSFIGLCSASNPGRCICTTQTCGAGILDTDRALQYVSGQALGTVTAAVINDNDVQQASSVSTQDTVIASTSAIAGPSENHGGGGGAFGPAALLGLAAAAGGVTRRLNWSASPGRP